jgi:chromosome segregation ATPase
MKNDRQTDRQTDRVYRQVVREMEEEVSSRYYGMVVDNFKCDGCLNCAVERTAGNKLFYHVVQNRWVATAIIQQLNRCTSHTHTQ